MKNILKSILLCATGASIAMGADQAVQADQYITSRVRATIQNVNKNTYASQADIIEGTKILVAKFKDTKKMYRDAGVNNQIADALGKALFNKAAFGDLDLASQKHQLSTAYIVAFASLKSERPNISAYRVFQDYSQHLLTKHAIDLQQLNILQSGTIQRLLDTIKFEGQ